MIWFLAIFIFCVVLFFYIHIHYHLKTSDSLEVYEIDAEISKLQLEEVCNLHQPVLFSVPVSLSLPSFRDLSLASSSSSSSPSVSFIQRTREKKMEKIEKDGDEPKEDASGEMENVKEPKEKEKEKENEKEKEKENETDDNEEEKTIKMTIADCMNWSATHPDDTFVAQQNSAFLKSSGLEKKIQAQDALFRPPFACNWYYDLVFGTVDAFTDLQVDINHRNYIVCLEGTVTIKVFSPESMYVLSDDDNEDFFTNNNNNNNNNKNNKTVSPPSSNLAFLAKKNFRNPWKPHFFSVTESSSTSCIAFLKDKNMDIVLHAGQAVFIPAYWWYSIRFSSENCLVLKMHYRTFMNNLAILPQLAKSFYEVCLSYVKKM
jgi:hypothetical protein